MPELKNIVGLFWNNGSDEDESAPKKQDKAPVVTTEVSQPRPSGPKEASSKMKKHLVSVIEKANLDGFDYIEFLHAMKDVEDDIPDEAARMRTVFATAKAMKVTAQGLIDAAGHYISVLEEEKKNFENALAEKNEAEIGDRRKELADIDIAINNNNAEIERLTGEIKAAESKKTKLSAEISEADSRITNARTDFATAYDELVASIKNDIKKIKTNLGGGKA